MRRLGYLLLVIGFAWIALSQGLQLIMRPGIRPILLAAYDKLEQGGRSLVPTGEAGEIIREAALACYQAQPLFILPGVMMLIGGLLIGRTVRGESTRQEPDHSN